MNNLKSKDSNKDLCIALAVRGTKPFLVFAEKSAGLASLPAQRLA